MLMQLVLLQSIPGAAAYMVSDISPAMLPALANADCNFVNILKVDGAVLNSVPRVVCYLDSFARQRRNADYQAVSFYSNLHFNYRNNPNSIGVGDFTVMGEEYSEAGGRHMWLRYICRMYRINLSARYM